MIRSAALCALAVIAAACALRGPGVEVSPPHLDPARSAAERALHYDHALERMRSYRARLHRVFAPLSVRSAEICGSRVVPWTGVAVVSPRDFADWSQHLETQADLRDAAARVLGMQDGPTVYLVDEGSPAQAAGIRPGDVILRANGRRVRRARDLHDALRRARGAPPRLELQRGAESHRAELALVPACEAFLYLSIGPNVLAYSTPQGITISTGMMDLLGSDEEIAFVLSHELAHGILETGRTSPKRVEQLADYLGCYIAARGGYDVARLPGLWRRWAELAPFGITSRGATHPGTPERTLLLEATVAEIERKREAGEALLPERPAAR